MKKLFSIVMAAVLSLSMAIPTFAATKAETATVISVQKKTAKFKLNNGVTITGKLASKSGTKLPSKNMRQFVTSSCRNKRIMQNIPMVVFIREKVLERQE